MVNWNLVAGTDGKFSSQDIRRNILTFIMKNHPGSLVEFIEKDCDSYRIDIRGGDALIFDFKGEFVKAV
ncbi:hypothetical protein [Sphingobacterium siyangense]|uniref:hypothetical protein n=1 Tax=Sphingobacterium siyangense TaxID=459529 RepID=UPI002FD9AD73